MTEVPQHLTIRIRVEGLSLWLDRNGYFDVLFPDDRLIDQNHHYLTAEGNGIGSTVLSGALLDLTALPVLLPPSHALSIAGWLPVKIDAGSLAADPSTAVSGKGLVGALRLPYGQLTQIDDHLDGPFAYDGYPSHFLGYGVEWLCTFSGDFAVRATHVNHLSGKATDILLGVIEPSTRTFHIVVKCLSDADRGSTDEPIKPGTALDEFKVIGYLSNASGAALPDAPVYNGGEERAGHANTRAAATAPSRTTRPERPCSGGYGV